MKNSEVLLLIPARYESSRFPGKPLSKINGIPLIEYVAKNCKETGFDYAVVTDSEKIESYLKECSLSVVRVDDDVQSGSERIALAYSHFFSKNDYKIIINIQGDEPLLYAHSILELAQFHLKNFHFDIITMVKKRSSFEDDFKNPNIVKCIYSEEDKHCLYFTRASAPYSRSGLESSWFQHIGVYSYKKDALLKFVGFPLSSLEKIESLEQLRALENNLKIGAMKTDLILIGVDEPADIKKVEGVLREQK